MDLFRAAGIDVGDGGRGGRSGRAAVSRTLLGQSERQKLTGKLEHFWELDFAAFRAEVKKAFKIEIPVKDRDGWEKYLADKSVEVVRLMAEIEAAEREIDAIVYKMFDLTQDEIKLLEDSLEGQY